MNKVLTPDLVLARAKTDSLYGIRNLNVWGNDLSDVSILRKLPNVEVLSLSVNKIASLKDFSSCLKLQELYLRKNAISDISEIRYLVNLPELRVLWLSDNPCTEVPNYREIVISVLPGLTKLDNLPISPEERANAKKLGVSLDDLAGSPKKEEPQRSEYSKPQKKQSSYDYAEPENKGYENNVYEEKNPRGYQQEPPQKKSSNAGGAKKYREVESQQDYESKPLRELPVYRHYFWKL